MNNLAARIPPEWKLAYLIVVVVALVVFPHAELILSVFVLQAALWIGMSLGWRPLARIFKRLALFFLVIGLSYAFVSVGDGDRWTSLYVGPWKIAINLGGLYVALIMCLRVLDLVFASAWVQESGRPGDFVRALERFRVPRFLAASIDGTIQLATGAGGRGDGGGGGRGQGNRGMSKKELFSLGFEQLRRGKLTFVTEMVERGLARAEEFVTRANPGMDRAQAKDIAVIVGSAAAIMGTKVLQILPGLPVAPGHKNVLIIPLLLLASGLTRARFGGLWTGLTAGMVSVLSGYGKFGVLEIAHFAVLD